jgi:glycosyltransferase 2 family protein
VNARARMVLGFVLSAVLLYFIFARLGGEGGIVEAFPRLWGNIRDANHWMLLLAVVVVTCTFPLRARRWRTILDPIAPGLPLGMLWRATAIGFGVNNVFPARVGELARAYALTRETPKVGFSGSFASLAVDRMFDAIVLVLLLIIGAFGLPLARAGESGPPVATYITGALVLVALMLAGLYAVVIFPARIISLYELFARRVAPRFEARGRSMLLSFAAGLGVLRSPRRFAAVFAWTVLHWLVNAAAFWIAFRAFGINVPFTAALFVQGIVALGVSLPSTPGYLGIFQAAAIIGLQAFGVTEAQAAGWAFGYWAASYIPITAIGMFYFVRMGLSLATIRAAASGDPDPNVRPAPGVRA